jgi:5'(3')-deoxyribonucleotidase
MKSFDEYFSPVTVARPPLGGCSSSKSIVKKGTLAVDFDDVLFPCLEGFVSYCKKNELAEGSLENLDDVVFTKIFNCNEEQCQVLFDKFGSSYEWRDLHHVAPPEACVKKLKEIKAYGYNLVIISARDHQHRELTHLFLETFFPDMFEKIVLCNYHGHVDEKRPRRSKAEVCRELDCFALLDDNPKYLREVEAAGTAGIPFGHHSWTKGYATENSVGSWDELDLSLLDRLCQKHYEKLK